MNYFIYLNNFFIHKNHTSHRINKLSSPTCEKPFIYDMCKKGFAFISAVKCLNIHLPIDTMKYIILYGVCNETFIELSHLSQHALIHRNDTSHANNQFCPPTCENFFIYGTCKK